MPEQLPEELGALQSIYRALLPLDSPTRSRVLAGVSALLEVEAAPQLLGGSEEARAAPEKPEPGRRKSLVELIQEKKPRNNADNIALFAYYRERFEGLQRFSRGDLRSYFGKARMRPPANFDRDFVEAVKRGYIHEDEADSYLTSKGLEAVETGFAGESRKTSERQASKKRVAKRAGSRRKTSSRKSAKRRKS